MAHYRTYQLDRKERAWRLVGSIEAESDAEAVATVEKFVAEYDLSVWQGARIVKTLPRRTV